MHKAQVQMDQRPQHKASHIEPYRRESGKYTWTHWHREPLLKYNLRSKTQRETINNWDLQKLKSCCKAKDTVNKTKRQPTEWEKIFTNLTSDRGLISKIYKELKKLDTKTLINPIKKMGYWSEQRILNRRTPNGQKTLKVMLNILSDQGNANQNNYEIPFYTGQIS